MPHSTYSKMFDILLTLNEIGAKDISEFAHTLNEKKIESFAIWRREAGAEKSRKTICSEESIRRTIRFTAEIELIDIENARICQINAFGLNALKGDNYPIQLGVQLIKYMRSIVGLPFEELERAIASIQLPQVPDRTTIYRLTTSEKPLRISEEGFRRLLFLLERCGRLGAQTRKMYKSSEA